MEVFLPSVYKRGGNTAGIFKPVGGGLFKQLVLVFHKLFCAFLFLCEKKRSRFTTSLLNEDPIYSSFCSMPAAMTSLCLHLLLISSGGPQGTETQGEQSRRGIKDVQLGK